MSESCDPQQTRMVLCHPESLQMGTVAVLVMEADELLCTRAVPPDSVFGVGEFCFNCWQHERDELIAYGVLRQLEAQLEL